MKKISLINTLKKTFKAKKVSKKKNIKSLVKNKKPKILSKSKKIKKTKVVNKIKKVKTQKKPNSPIKSKQLKTDKKSITEPNENLHRISKNNEQKPEIKKIKKQDTEKKEYKVKDYVVYPKHGVGQITEFKKMNIGGIDIEAMGVDNSFFKSVTELTSSEQVKALCDGKIDAFGYSVGFPNGAMEQAATCAAKAMPINLTGDVIDGIISGADYYASATIPKGTYTKQKKDVTTFGVKATVVTSMDVSEDLVYQVTKAVFENFDDFRKQHPAFAPLEKKNMIADGLSAPLHPGAVKYYKEAGLM